MSNPSFLSAATCLHPVELLNGVGVGLGMLGLEGLPLGPLHEGGGRPDQEHNQQDLHDALETEWM